MKREIKIFIGSSIKEFERDRESIENFIYRVSRVFEKNYKICLEPLLCRNFDDAYTEIRKQEEYNKKVRDSDFCFFLFFTKAGEFTREEFEVARKKFEETGKPKIYTYFKILGGEQGEESLYSFMEELDKIFGHYYGTFEHIDTVKLRILRALQVHELDFIEVKIEGDECIVDEEMSFSVENISEFANNKMFHGLKAEFGEVEKRYSCLRDKYENDECTESEKDEYFKLAGRRRKLINSVDELRKRIFDMSLRMCEDEVHGKITARQREAYRLFEAGELDRACVILNIKEIEDDFNGGIAFLEEEAKKRAVVFIGELETKIRILYARINYDGRFDEIEDIYEKIVPVALKYGVEISSVVDYLGFLLQQNKIEKAFQISEKLQKAFFDGYGTDRDKVGSMINRILCYALAGEHNKELETALRAIDFYTEVLEKTGKQEDEFMADLYSKTADAYSKFEQKSEAEDYYNRSFKLYESLSEASPGEYDRAMSRLAVNMAVFYRKCENRKEAERYYGFSERIMERLYSETPEETATDLAAMYMSMGIFYSGHNEELALKYKEKAVRMLEKEEKKNPERIGPTLGLAYMNLMNAYMKIPDFDFSETRKCIARTLYFLQRAAENNPELYAVYLINVYGNAGGFFDEKGYAAEAEKFYISAVRAIELTSEKLDRIMIDERIDAYNRLTGFYHKRNFKEKNIELHKLLINFFERLFELSPENMSHELAITYFNYGLLTQDSDFLGKALALAEKFPDHPYCRHIIDSLKK